MPIFIKIKKEKKNIQQVAISHKSRTEKNMKLDIYFSLLLEQS